LIPAAESGRCLVFALEMRRQTFADGHYTRRYATLPFTTIG
jgi:hypothetical protein